MYRNYLDVIFDFIILIWRFHGTIWWCSLMIARYNAMIFRYKLYFLSVQNDDSMGYPGDIFPYLCRGSYGTEAETFLVKEVRVAGTIKRAKQFVSKFSEWRYIRPRHTWAVPRHFFPSHNDLGDLRSSLGIFPHTVCPRWGLITVNVKAGASSGCSLWSAAFYL